MKTRFTKKIALLTAVVMLILTMVGCGSAPVAISFGSTEITANMFNYWMSTYKAVYLYSLLGTTTDNPQLWAMQFTEGITYGDYLGALAASDIATKAVCHELFAEYALELTDEDTKTIEDHIEKITTATGGKAQLNSALSAFGVNIDILRQINIFDAKVAKLQEHLYGEDGIQKATEEELDKFFKENYYRAKYIFISTKFEYERDENGEVLIDEEQGTYKTRELTSDEITAKKALAEELDQKVKDGEDFDALVLEHSMDLGLQTFTDGYYFMTTSAYVTQEIINEVASMSVGETKTVTNDNGTWIVRRYELEDKAYDEEMNAPLFSNFKASVNTIKLQELVASYSNALVIDPKVIASYPIGNCSPNFYY